MRCPNCNKENEATNRFCIFCGSILQKPEDDTVSEPESLQSEESSGLVLKLQQEVRRLATIVNLMNERLATLERRQETTAPLFSEESRAEESVSSQEAIAAAPGSAPVTERWESPVSEPSIPPSKQSRSPGTVEREWEQILGGNWLARIGVLAIIIGAAFFLKLAFDKNWIGPSGRVLLGIAAGVVMLGGGHYWHKKYPVFANAISGGGIALLYLSVFAAYSFYDLIGFYPVILLILLICIISVVLALRYNAMALAILGIIGAFLAPLILTASDNTAVGASLSASSIWLLVYIIVVDAGVLWLSTFRNWRWFTLISLLGSLAVFCTWYDQFGSDISLAASMGFLTAIFLIFNGATMLYHVIWHRESEPYDYALIVFNSFIYFVMSYIILWDDYRAWLGGFTLLLSGFYGTLAYTIWKRSTENIRLAYFSIGIALAFLTLAIPVQLRNTGWTTITWVAQGTVLVWLSYKLRISQFRIWSYIVFLAVIFRLLFFDVSVNIRTFTPVFNERFLVFVISIAAMYLVSYLHWREKDNLMEKERDLYLTYPVFLIAANFFTIYLLSAEVWGIFTKQIMNLSAMESIGSAGDSLRSARNLSLTGLWAIYAVILLITGIKKQCRPVRLAGLGLIFIPIVKVFVYDVFALEQLYRIIAFVGLGILLVASGYLYQRYRDVIKEFVVSK